MKKLLKPLLRKLLKSFYKKELYNNGYILLHTNIYYLKKSIEHSIAHPTIFIFLISGHIIN